MVTGEWVTVYAEILSHKLSRRISREPPGQHQAKGAGSRGRLFPSQPPQLTAPRPQESQVLWLVHKLDLTINGKLDYLQFFAIKTVLRDFSSGPVVKNPLSNAGNVG